MKHPIFKKTRHDLERDYNRKQKNKDQRWKYGFPPSQAYRDFVENAKKEAHLNKKLTDF